MIDINECPLTDTQLKGFECVIDIIPTNLCTVLLQKAKMMDMLYINGLYMLIAQALKSHDIWNDINIDRSIIKNIYNDMMDSKYV